MLFLFSLHWCVSICAELFVALVAFLGVATLCLESEHTEISSFFLTGQEAWIRKLKWPGLKEFSQQRWKALYVSPESTDTAAFHKAYENFAFFWILKAGHMVNNIAIGVGCIITKKTEHVYVLAVIFSTAVAHCVLSSSC